MHTNLDEANDRLHRLQEERDWMHESMQRTEYYHGEAGVTAKEREEYDAVVKKIDALYDKIYEFEEDQNVGFARFKGDW